MRKEFKTKLLKFENFFAKKKLLSLVGFAFLILGLSHGTYFREYRLPTVTFWDESYHIPSAAKYLQGVFFMEPHPPLGKMLIAWGEKLLDANRGKTFGFESVEA